MIVLLYLELTTHMGHYRHGQSLIPVFQTHDCPLLVFPEGNHSLITGHCRVLGFDGDSSKFHMIIIIHSL